MAVYWWLLGLVTTNLVLPIWVLFAAKKKLSRGMLLTVSVLGTAITGWQFSLLLTFLGGLSETISGLTVTFAFTFAFVLLFGVLLLSIFFPRTLFPKNKIEIAALTVVVFLIGINLFLLLTSDLIISSYVNGVVTYGRLGFLYQITLLLGMVITLTRFVSRFKKEVLSQEYYKYLLMFMIALIPVALILNFVLPLLGVLNFVIMGSLVFSSVNPFLAYTIARSRLYTVRYTFKRIQSIAIVALIYYLMFLLVGFVAIRIWGSIFSVEALVYNTVTAIIFTLLMEPLQIGITNLIYRKNSFLEILNELKTKLSTVTNSNGIKKQLSSVLSSNIAGITISFYDRKQIGQLLRNRSLRDAFDHFIDDKAIAIVDDLPVESQLKKFLLEKSIVVFVLISRKEEFNHGYYVVTAKHAEDVYIPQELLDLLQGIQPNWEIAFQRNQLFEKTRRFASELAAKVRLRTREIEEARKALEEKNLQLQSTYDELKTLDESKSDFISMASHQLRTPVSIIKGYVSMLLEGDFGEVSLSAISILNNVQKGVDQLNDIVDGILNASRIEHGKVQANFEKLDAIKILSDVVHKIESKASSKGLALNFSNKVKEFVRQIDHTKLREVFMNLIDNAINYTQEGAIDVTAQIESGSLIIKVKDTGIGIPKKQVGKLFQRFLRLDNAKRIRPDGTGIGLYISKTFVEAHGGKIWVESVEGKGSTFIVQLPKKLK